MDFINRYSNYLKNEMEVYNYFKSGIKETVPYAPQMIYIEPTNACNLNCILCARWKMTRPIKFLTLDQLKIVIDKLLAENIKCPITFCGNGESLLNKDVFSMMEYAKSKDFHVSMISNATFLTKENADKLVRSGIDKYQFSCDSLKEANYEQIHRNSNFKRTLSNIFYFLKINEERGHPVFTSVAMVKFSKNKDEIEDMVSFWKTLPLDNIYTAGLLTLQADSGVYEEAKLTRLGKEHRTCSFPWRLLSVASNGDILACPMDFDNKYPLGNIFKDSLTEIWNGEKIRKLRRALMDNKLDYFTEIHHDCAKCTTPYVDKWNSTEDCFDDIPPYAARMALFFMSKEMPKEKMVPLEKNKKYQELIKKINLLESKKDIL